MSWTEIHRDAKRLARMLAPQGAFVGIVALARGGLVPAAIVAQELNVRTIETLSIASYDETVQGPVTVLNPPAAAVKTDGRGWLMIDDLVDTGATARAARKLLPDAHFAVVYAKPRGFSLVDTYVEAVEQNVWLDFPWDPEPPAAPPLRDRTGSADKKK
ncbi:MAG: xanthine phosphoribosyltransferase [Rhodospirillales bacterium]|nr:xanthine phosphoribosyltransferase [Rhodospirillales bacterium]